MPSVFTREVYMKVLFTGAASHHANPSINVTFFRTLAERVSTFAEIDWASPSLTWSEDFLNQYDYVVVGLTPPTSQSANKIYGAMNLINILYDSPKLIIVIDHPQLWQYKHAFNSIDSSPLSIFEPFYSKRKDFSIAKELYVDSISQANYKLLSKKWPKTIYPSLPFKNTRNIDKLLGLSAAESLIPVNLDAFLLTEGFMLKNTIGDYWLVDQKKTKWAESLFKFLRIPIKDFKSYKKISDYEANSLINDSFGLMFSPQDRGVGLWWSYRLIQALNSGTLVLSDWKETEFIGPEWSILGYDLENQTTQDIINIAKLQKQSYKNGIPTQGDSDKLLNSIFK